MPETDQPGTAVWKSSSNATARSVNACPENREPGDSGNVYSRPDASCTEKLYVMLASHASGGTANAHTSPPTFEPGTVRVETPSKIESVTEPGTISPNRSMMRTSIRSPPALKSSGGPCANANPTNARGSVRPRTKSPRSMSETMMLPLSKNGYDDHAPLNCAELLPGKVSKKPISVGFRGSLASKTRRPER